MVALGVLASLLMPVWVLPSPQGRSSPSFRCCSAVSSPPSSRSSRSRVLSGARRPQQVPRQYQTQHLQQRGNRQRKPQPQQQQLRRWHRPLHPLQARLLAGVQAPLSPPQPRLAPLRLRRRELPSSRQPSLLHRLPLPLRRRQSSSPLQRQRPPPPVRHPHLPRLLLSQPRPHSQARQALPPPRHLQRLRRHPRPRLHFLAWIWTSCPGPWRRQCPRHRRRQRRHQPQHRRRRRALRRWSRRLHRASRRPPRRRRRRQALRRHRLTRTRRWRTLRRSRRRRQRRRPAPAAPRPTTRPCRRRARRRRRLTP